MRSEVDVLVIGSGAAGLSAAIAAARGGASVLVLEKATQVGGTTAWSGGAAWVPGNGHMADIGASDTVADATRYISALLGNHYDPTMTEAFLREGPAAIAFLERETRWVRFVAYPGPDYHPDLPGAATKGRSMLAAPFDARRLGRNLRRLRHPKPELTALAGMQVEMNEIPHLQGMWRSASSFRIAAKLLGRYAADRLRYGRHTRLIRGNALAAALFGSALELGVEIETDVAAKDLVVEDGTVTRATVETNGSTRSIAVRKGVVLAAGGFSSNREMAAEHLPAFDRHITILPAENRGDTVSMARRIGAAFGENNAANAIWAPASRHTNAHGRQLTYPHFGLDRYKPGAIMVDGRGDRFVNEAASYHVIVNVMHARGIVPAWLVCDRPFLRKYGMGMARAAPYSSRKWIREGYLVEAPTITALAAAIGCDAGRLQLSVDRMNEASRTGVDADFGKGADIYNRAGGDPAHRPNPCLGPIGTGPFYALPLYTTDVGTTLGLRVNAGAQVLDNRGTPIGGLFAAGLDMNSVLRGFYAGAGTMLGPALTFGHVAGRNAARRVPYSP